MRYPIGIGDASSYDTNKYTDWNVARHHGAEFGIVRACTTGAWVNGKPSIIMDTMYPMNAEKMIGAGVKRMPYAWLDPRYKVCSPVDQANMFLDILEKYGGPGELGPMLDLEDVPAAKIAGFIGIGGYIKQWLDTVECALYKKPRIYCNLSYISAYLFNASIREDWLCDYGLVIANWGVTAPWVPQPWGPMNWDCWQYRADAPGRYYGFFNQAGLSQAAPYICMAVWNGELVG
jgi:GH25 family lysozyme M1 (1,4-beta-N-acetylmuramidase)